MTDEIKQPVVDAADTQAKPAVEVNDARKDDDNLDALLNEYDKGTPKPVVKTEPEPKPVPVSPSVQRDPAIAEVQRYIFREDMSKVINAVRGDLDPEVFDDDLIESFVDGQARKDPRLAQAWLERHDKPAQFERIKTELGKSLAKKFSKLHDKQATDDREAVTAAVRGASTRAPESTPANYAGKSDAEFRDDVHKKYGFRPL